MTAEWAAAKRKKALKRVRAFVNDMPEEAQDVYYGRSNKLHYRDETSIDDREAESALEWCEHCDQFHIVSYASLFEIEKIVPFVNGLDYRVTVTHIIENWDNDGNRGRYDSCDLSHVNHDKWYEKYSFKELQESWREYYEHVAKTGDDFLQIFYGEDKKNTARKAYASLPGYRYTRQHSNQGR